MNEKEIKETLKRSGYLIENRVINWLNNNSFFVEPNKTFFDISSGKSREMDVMADTLNFFDDEKSKMDIGLKTVLLIEVINTPVPLIFFKGIYEEQYELPYMMRFISDAKKNIGSFMDHIDFTIYHYYNSSLSTQYCSFEKKRSNSEWMAIHPNSIYDTFKKLSIVSDNLVQEYQNDPHKKKYNRFFRYQPVLILNDYLYQAEIIENELSLAKKELISFSFNYSTQDEQKSLIIDVITENFLPKYSDIIFKEDKIVYKEIKKVLKAII